MTVINHDAGANGNPPYNITTTTTTSDWDGEAIQRAPDEVENEPIGRHLTKETSAIRHSEDLRRTASHMLTQVASRMTTRSWPEPPPPPDGGVKAWTQVAMGWLVMVR